MLYACQVQVIYLLIHSLVTIPRWVWIAGSFCNEYGSQSSWPNHQEGVWARQQNSKASLNYVKAYRPAALFWLLSFFGGELFAAVTAAVCPFCDSMILCHCRIDFQTSNFQENKAYLILENVARKQTAAILRKEIGQTGYILVCIMANNFTFGVPQSRCRLYLLAVCPLQVAATHSPEKQVVWLEDKTILVGFVMFHSFGRLVLSVDVSCQLTSFVSQWEPPEKRTQKKSLWLRLKHNW